MSDLPDDELHARMPDLRAQQTNLRNQIEALDTQQCDGPDFLVQALRDVITKLRG